VIEVPDKIGLESLSEYELFNSWMPRKPLWRTGENENAAPHLGSGCVMESE